MMRPWVSMAFAVAAMAQDGSTPRLVDHGWGMALGTGFSAVPLVIDVHYTFSPGIGIYLGGGGTPHPGDNNWDFNLNFNDHGTLRKTSSEGHIGIAVTRLPNVAWGVGYGRRTSGWEVDHGGWFTAEETARLDNTEVHHGPHGWIAYYPGRILGLQVQAGPGWGGISAALRFR